MPAKPWSEPRWFGDAPIKNSEAGMVCLLLSPRPWGAAGRRGKRLQGGGEPAACGVFISSRLSSVQKHLEQQSWLPLWQSLWSRVSSGDVWPAEGEMPGTARCGPCPHLPLQRSASTPGPLRRPAVRAPGSVALGCPTELPSQETGTHVTVPVRCSYGHPGSRAPVRPLFAC